MEPMVERGERRDRKRAKREQAKEGSSDPREGSDDREDDRVGITGTEDATGRSGVGAGGELVEGCPVALGTQAVGGTAARSEPHEDGAPPSPILGDAPPAPAVVGAAAPAETPGATGDVGDAADPAAPASGPPPTEPSREPGQRHEDGPRGDGRRPDGRPHRSSDYPRVTHRGVQRQGSRPLVLFDLNGVLVQHVFRGYGDHAFTLRPGIEHVLRLARAGFQVGVYTSATRKTACRAVHAILQQLREKEREKLGGMCGSGYGEAPTEGGRVARETWAEERAGVDDATPSLAAADATAAEVPSGASATATEGPGEASATVAGEAPESRDKERDAHPAPPPAPSLLPDDFMTLILCREHCRPAPPEAIAARGGKPWDTVKPLSAYFADAEAVALVDDSPHKILEEEAACFLRVPAWEGLPALAEASAARPPADASDPMEIPLDEGEPAQGASPATRGNPGLPTPAAAPTVAPAAPAEGATDRTGGKPYREEQVLETLVEALLTAGPNPAGFSGRLDGVREAVEKLVGGWPPEPPAPPAAPAPAPVPAREGDGPGEPGAAPPGAIRGASEGGSAPAAPRHLTALHHELVRFALLAAPTAEEADAAGYACRLVQRVAKKLWRGVKAEAFGSRATGLALPGGDLDVTLVAKGKGEGAEGEEEDDDEGGGEVDRSDRALSDGAGSASRSAPPAPRHAPIPFPGGPNGAPSAPSAAAEAHGDAPVCAPEPSLEDVLALTLHPPPPSNTPSSRLLAKGFRSTKLGGDPALKEQQLALLEALGDALASKGVLVGDYELISARVPLLKCKIRVPAARAGRAPDDRGLVGAARQVPGRGRAGEDGGATASGGRAGAGGEVGDGRLAAASPTDASTRTGSATAPPAAPPPPRPPATVAVDVSVGQEAGSRVARALSRAVSRSPGAREVLLAAKAILQVKRLNTAFTGGVSSFVLANLVLAFFQEREKAGKGSTGGKTAGEGTADASTSLPLPPDSSGAPPAPWAPYPQPGASPAPAHPAGDLGALLYSFLDFFGRTFDYEGSCVSVREGGVVDRAWGRGTRGGYRGPSWKRGGGSRPPAGGPTSLVVCDLIDREANAAAGAERIAWVARAFADSADVLGADLEDVEASGAGEAGRITAAQRTNPHVWAGGRGGESVVEAAMNGAGAWGRPDDARASEGAASVRGGDERADAGTAEGGSVSGDAAPRGGAPPTAASATALPDDAPSDDPASPSHFPLLSRVLDPVLAVGRTHKADLLRLELADKLASDVDRVKAKRGWDGGWAAAERRMAERREHAVKRRAQWGEEEHEGRVKRLKQSPL